MKIRLGYVSNSSSSSFIVAWDKKPESIEEVKNILFGDAKSHECNGNHAETLQLAETIYKDTDEASISLIKEEQANLYAYYGKTWYSKGYKPNQKLMDEYTKQYDKYDSDLDVYNEILRSFTDIERKQFERQRKLERVVGEKHEQVIREKEYFELQDNIKECQNFLWSENDIMKQLVEESVKNLLEDYNGKFFSIYDYGDDDGSYFSILEHGEVFYNLDHWRISKH